MAYNDAITILEKKLFSFDPDAERVYNLIKGLKDFEPVDKPKEVKNQVQYIKLVFDRQWAATEQVLFALKYIGHVAKASEIVTAIKEFDAAFDKGLSTPFYKLKEAGLIAIYNPTISENNPTGSNHTVYYGLKEWFNGENDVKPEYSGDAYVV